MPQNIRTFLFETASSRSSSQKQTTRPEACCRAHKCWPPVLIVQAPGKSLEDVWPTLSIDSALTCSKLERLTFPSKHAMKGFTVKSRVPNLDYDFWSALLHRPVLCPIHILGSGNHQRSDNPRQTPQHGAPPGHVSAGLFEGCLMLMLNGTALTFMILFFCPTYIACEEAWLDLLSMLQRDCLTSYVRCDKASLMNFDPTANWNLLQAGCMQCPFDGYNHIAPVGLEGF